MMRHLLVLAAALLVARPTAAQRDTTATALNPVVVTAERATSVLGSSTSSVSRISVADLLRTPHATVADALQRIPGFALVNFDGLGFDPQVMVRGFYGGGEADYVVMLVDGRPVSQVQNGTIPWAALPALSAIESIEVVRGSSSALYGDAAIGGVINIITRKARDGAQVRWNLGGGSAGGLTGSVSGSALRASLWGGGERTDGYRDHADRNSIRAGATIPLETGDTKLNVSVGLHDQSYDEPGALLASLLDENRKASDALFRLDHTDDLRFTLGVDATRGRVAGYLGGEVRNTEAIRTLALAPGFGDTKERATSATRLLGSLQYSLDRLIVGADIAFNELDSKYYDIVTGDRDDHIAASGARGDLAASGDGLRLNGAVFAQYTQQIANRVRLSLGARFDWLSDEFEPKTSEGDKPTATHAALSPKLGVNVRLAETDRRSANVYVSASGSFKAPTLDQLFDQRPIPVPFPPFALTTSNALLEPQHGFNLEAGIYQTAQLGASMIGTMTFSAYQMDMSDEIDFNVETLRYVNIGKSRHRGIELGGSLTAPGHASVYANYTLQKATVREGENDGRQLKAIPRDNISFGLTMYAIRQIEAGIVFTRASGAFADDANEIDLEAQTRLDARVAYRIAEGLNLYVESRNVLGKKYNTTGFVDPAGTGELYFYPAAGRTVSAGVRRGW